MLRMVMLGWHTPQCATAQELHRILLLSGPMPMPNSKVEWLKFMADRGEVLPESWTVAQIKARWEETRMGVAEVNEGLQAKLKMLYAKARKKSDLVAFMKSEGYLNTEGTVAVLTSRVEKAMHEEFEPTGGELVGFGKYGDLTMRQVTEKHASYIEWCKETVWEDSNVHWRMHRLVQYATRHHHATAVMESKGKTMMRSMPDPPDEKSSGGFSVVSEAVYSAKQAATVAADVENLKSQMEAMHNYHAALMVKHEDLQRENAELRKENAELQLQATRSKNRKEM